MKDIRDDALLLDRVIIVPPKIQFSHCPENYHYNDSCQMSCTFHALFVKPNLDELTKNDSDLKNDLNIYRGVL